MSTASAVPGERAAVPGERAAGAGESRVAAGAQVSALVAMRLSALRGPAVVRAVSGVALLGLVAVAAVVVGTRLPGTGAQNARLLMPTAWLGFAFTVAVAAGTSGGRTLLPREQAVAFPVSPAAEQLGALLLAPLNMAWVLQALGLLTLAGWAFGPVAPVPALVLTTAWMLACTTLAATVGWAVELARTTRSGPWLVRGAVAAGVVGAAALVATNRVGAVLDDAPTVRFVVAIVAAGAGRHRDWLLLLLVLVASVAVTYAVGVRMVSWLQRRTPLERGRAETRRHPERPDPAGALAAALRVDRAGVRRSVPVRRGLVTLIGVPALAAAAAGLEWPLTTLLPGLVASGAGLLFGVNALGLDGPGARWRESLPVLPRVSLTARLIVVAETCVGGALVAAVVGAVRAPDPASVAEVVALTGAVVATTAQVVARCASWSVDRPYATSLRDSRDQPAPPLAMAGYSARLAVVTTCTGLLFSLCARFDLTAPAVAATLAIVALSLRRVLSALRRWDDAGTRSRVVSVVSA